MGINNFISKLLAGGLAVFVAGLGVGAFYLFSSSSSAFQKKYPNFKFLKNTPDYRQKWISKRESFKKQFANEEEIKARFKGKNIEGIAENYIVGYESNQVNSLENIEYFLKIWCFENENTDREDLLPMLKEWCAEGD